LLFLITDPGMTEISLCTTDPRPPHTGAGLATVINSAEQTVVTGYALALDRTMFTGATFATVFGTGIAVIAGCR
jgi:hypothetical protein